MFLKEGKLVVAFCVFILTISFSSFAQGQIQTKMVVTQKATSGAYSPIKAAVAAKVGNDEAKMAAAMKKVRAEIAKDRIILTAQQYKEWEASKAVKLGQAKSNKEKEKVRRHIAKREARIVIVEDII